MLYVRVRAEGGEQAVTHHAGPLEFGRGPAGEFARIVLSDPYVSRDHLRVTELDGQMAFVENLSRNAPVRLAAGGEVPVGGTDVLALPLELGLGNTRVNLDWTGVEVPASPAAGTRPPEAVPSAYETWGGVELDAGMATIARPASLEPTHVALRELGESPDAATLTRWFETLVGVQQAAGTSGEFLGATARAVVELVGMDQGMVLRFADGAWHVVAHYPDAASRVTFSHTVLQEVARVRRTVFKNLGAESSSASLVGIDTVVAAPFFGATGALDGVVYGARSLRVDQPNPNITPLEAQVVQVLAAATGAGLAREQEREEALRARVQFEQFFSAQLASQLAADPSLLDGRERVVTLFFSDVRNFSRIAERLGARRTFTMMQDLMNLQSDHIRETDGVVVDYVGDGLLAMWNAPADQPDHAARACRAAMSVQRDLPALSAGWEAEAGEPLRIGIGIHSGSALVGNTGSRVKFKYGPMGPAVNLASRVENATKALGVNLLITGATRDLVGETAGTRRLGGMRVQGFAEPVDVYELFPGEPPPGWYLRRDAFEQALEHYERREWTEACRLLAGLLSVGGDYDLPSLQLLGRAVECLRSRPDPFDPALSIDKQV
jgi:adenylate cyclase